MTYEEALNAIHAVHWQGHKPGLGRTRALLAALGDPHKALRFVHVAGTNGKGSTCAMLEAGLIAAGVRTGRFTSPHLERYEERVRVDGIEVSPERTAAFIAWAQEHAPDAAFFDLTLALAHDARDHAPVRRLLRAPVPACQRQLHRARLADRAREALHGC